MSLTMAAIGGVVAATVKYLLASKGAELAAGKAAEKIGEKGGEALINAGRDAFTRLKAALGRRGAEAEKANRALANVEAEPDDKAYQEKLTAELEKLAASDAELRKLLEELSAEVQQAGGPVAQGSVNVSGQGRIYGPTAGTSTGTMSGTYTFGDRDEDKRRETRTGEVNGRIDRV
jgi:hypothetical protein